MPKLSKQQMWAYGIIIAVFISLFKWGGGTIYDNIIDGQKDIKKDLGKVKDKQIEILEKIGWNSGRIYKMEPKE